jgi:hypothetical protein
MEQQVFWMVTDYRDIYNGISFVQKTLFAFSELPTISLFFVLCKEALSQ